jgi:hypothetical protein
MSIRIWQNLRGFSDAKKRGNYKVAERLRMKQQIYRMILDGYTYAKIMDELQISERTLYRYLDVIFSEEQDSLEKTLGGREEMRRQIMICRDRLLEDRRTLQEWMKDPNFKDKVSAMHLAAEISAAVLRLYDNGPGLLSKRHAFPNYNSLTGPGTTGARLVLKKNPAAAATQQPKEEKPYDELDFDDEDDVGKEDEQSVAKTRTTTLSPREQEEEQTRWR